MCLRLTLIAAAGGQLLMYVHTAEERDTKGAFHRWVVRIICMST